MMPDHDVIRRSVAREWRLYERTEGAVAEAHFLMAQKLESMLPMWDDADTGFHPALETTK